MPSIKELRLKIRSLRNTSKITSAMKLVASSKLRRSQEAMIRNRPYLQGLTDLVQGVLKSVEQENIDLMAVRHVKTIRVIVVTSDKGLCGSFNNALLRSVAYRIHNLWKGLDIEIETLGKKGNDYFTKRAPMPKVKNHAGIVSKPIYIEAVPVIQSAIEDFRAGKVDAVYVAYNHFKSMISQEPTVSSLLPLAPQAQSLASPTSTSKASLGNMIFEPSAPELLDRLLPQYLGAVFFKALLENQAGEHVSRMNAMENATNNTLDLIKRYTLVMNRARQSAITTELTEIVAGAESLKG